MTKEHILQNQIRLALSETCMVFRVNVGKGYTPDGRYFDTGVPVGFSDLFGHRKSDGRAFYIEVKTPDGRVRRDQEKFIKAMKENGALAGVARSVEDAIKIINAKINNLESNLHIEIDMERLEDSSKALSYIGIEIAEALKLIPVPEEQLEAIAEQNEAEEKVIIPKEMKTESKVVEEVKETNVAKAEVVKEEVNEAPVENVQKVEEKAEKDAEVEREQYVQETTFEAKPSLWQRFKRSKLVRAATYVFRIRVRIELPEALPEGRGENA